MRPRHNLRLSIVTVEPQDPTDPTWPYLSYHTRGFFKDSSMTLILSHPFVLFEQNTCPIALDGQKFPLKVHEASIATVTALLSSFWFFALCSTGPGHSELDSVLACSAPSALCCSAPQCNFASAMRLDDRILWFLVYGPSQRWRNSAITTRAVL